MEFSQTILEPLKVRDYLGVVGGVMQRAVELKRGPEFLAPLAQVMQGLGGRVRRNRRAAPCHLGEGHPGALRGKQAGGPPCGCMGLPRTTSAYSGRPPVALLNAV